MLTRVAVLVSGNGTNLQALLDAQGAGRIPSGEIVLAVSNNPKAYALERAKAAGIPAAVIPGGEEEALLGALAAHRAQIVVLAGYLRILSPKVIEKYPDRIINVHPSLIPAFSGKGYYGLRVHEAALARGVKVTGATVHLVNQVPDGGRILLQKAVEVLPGDTPEVLQRRVMEQAEWQILPQAVQNLCQAYQEGRTL